VVQAQDVPLGSGLGLTLGQELDVGYPDVEEFQGVRSVWSRFREGHGSRGFAGLLVEGRRGVGRFLGRVVRLTSRLRSWEPGEE